MLCLHALCALLMLGGDQEEDLAATITTHELEAHLRLLASDLLEGRESGERGGAIAALYIASEFQKLGLKMAGDDGYFQRFDISGGSLPSDDTGLTVVDGAGATLMQAGASQGVDPHFVSADGDVQAPIVFCGFGISAPDAGYDDYAGIDVQGKIAVVFRHEPWENDEKSPLKSNATTDARSMRRGSVMAKVGVARDHGAVALI